MSDTQQAIRDWFKREYNYHLNCFVHKEISHLTLYPNGVCLRIQVTDESVKLKFDSRIPDRYHFDIKTSDPDLFSKLSSSIVAATKHYKGFHEW